LGLFKPLRPTAVLTPPGSITAGTPASFSAGASSDPYPGGSFSSYTWSWGDGTPDDGGASPLHSYGAAGTYTVTVTVTDNYGLTSSASASVNVSPPPPAPPNSSSANYVGVTEVAGYQEGAAAPVPDAKLASTALAASASGAVTIRVSCPAGESSCSGTVTLRTLDAVSASAPRAAKAKKAILTLASGSFNVSGGKTKAVTLHLSAKARGLLARSHLLRVRATIVAHDPSGATHTTQAVVTLRGPKARHGRG
jgi:PKD repeat protein